MAEVQLYLHHKVGFEKENYIPGQKMLPVACAKKYQSWNLAELRGLEILLQLLH